MMRILVVGEEANAYCKDFLLKWDQTKGRVSYVHPPVGAVSIEHVKARLFYSAACMYDMSKLAQSALKNGTSEIALYENWTFLKDTSGYCNEIDDSDEDVFLDICDGASLEFDMCIDAGASDDLLMDYLSYIEIAPLSVDSLLAVLDGKM